MSGASGLRLGTRGSPLALAQAELAAKALGGAEAVPIRVAGDERGAGGGGSNRGARGTEAGRGARGAAVPGGDKARFVREIEAALLAGEVDLAVHSAKDLPGELPDGLEVSGVLEREDPRDAFIGAGESLDSVPEGARVGTSSLRRRAQLLAVRPDLEIVPIRGNVDTRLRKLADGELDGIVLAAAGLRRLGREGEIAFAFDPAELTPAPGQGTIALESRLDDPAVEPRAQTATDRAALAELRCERAAVAALDASCDTPLGVLARIESSRMRASGFCGLPDGSEWIRDEVEADASEPEAIGAELAGRLLGAGAAELLRRAGEMARAEGVAR